MIPAAIDNLKQLGARRDKLMGELERSLALQALWPEVFAAGSATSCRIGSPLGRATTGGIRYALRLRVSGAGEVREFPQAEVPAVLWPHTEANRLP